MKLERRALSAEERKELSAVSSHQIPWSEIFVFSLFAGTGVGAIFAIAFTMLLGFSNIEIFGIPSLDLDRLALILGPLGALGFLSYMVFSFIRQKGIRTREREQIIDRDDLIVEVRTVNACKLVREPEHGQCMFFVRTDDGETLFIFEGQDELQDDWKTNPLGLPESDKPRDELKVIRHPKTKKGIMVCFSGSTLPIRQCFEIGLAPASWPASGAVLRSPWDEVQRRYRLKPLVFGDI